MRMWMDYVVNGLARTIVLFTFPLLISTEGPLDFVKDCTAVFFLTQLDDIDANDAKNIYTMTARIKFSLFWEHYTNNKYEGKDDEALKIPIRLSYDEKIAMDEPADNSVKDHFELQRKWLIEYVDENAEGAKKTTCGASYLVKMMAYKIITQKGAPAFGNVLGKLMDGEAWEK